MTYRKFSSRTGAAAVILILALLAVSALPALAAVELTVFTATAQADNTIRVYWEAATELNTAAYRLYRAETQIPTDWGTPIHEVAAAGGVSRAEYTYADVNVTPGVTYYYRLVDISVSSQVTEHQIVSARIMLPGETATNTPPTTDARTPVPTATTGPGSVVVEPTATATLPPPTATQRFTNTPPAPAASAPFGTPVVSAPTSPVFANPSIPTLPVVASLATPTGQPLLPTPAPVALPPTIPPPPTVPLLPSPTIAIVAQAPVAGLETATPVPTREVTPIIFGATSEAPEAPGSEQAAAAQGGRNMGGVLVAGGALVGLAGIAAAVLLFARARKG
jgi:hypothetical protein